MSTSTISGDYPEMTNQSMAEPIITTYNTAYNQAIQDVISQIEQRALLSPDDKAFYKKFEKYHYPYSALIDDAKTLIKH